jgi:heptaprenyl diphosphate synthase
MRTATVSVPRARSAPSRIPDNVHIHIPDSAARRVVGRCVGEERLAGELRDCVGRLLRIVESEPGRADTRLLDLAAGGKRLRPLFVLAAGHSASRDLAGLLAARVVRSAVVVELLHLASLVHDDVMDEATTRHGAATINAREGNIRAVLAGDFLLAQAMSSAATLGRAEAAIAARTFVRLCEGQAYESADLFDVNRTEESYFRTVAGKTGALFEASCRLGAMSGALPLKATAALGEYGMALGIAFQLLDDVLDFTATAQQLGKPSGHDVIEGVYTLPLLRALRRRPGLARILADPDRESAAAGAVELVRSSGAIEATLDEAREYAARAVRALSGAAPSITTDAADMLTALAEALVPASGQIPLPAPRRVS